MNRTTLELSEGRVLYVRHHTSDEIPGPYEDPFALEELSAGVWEAKIAIESMSLRQRRDFSKAVMERDDISKIVWTRHIDGKIIHRETIFRK